MVVIYDKKYTKNERVRDDICIRVDRANNNEKYYLYEVMEYLEVRSDAHLASVHTYIFLLGFIALYYGEQSGLAMMILLFHFYYFFNAISKYRASSITYTVINDHVKTICVF